MARPRVPHLESVHLLYGLLLPLSERLFLFFATTQTVIGATSQFGPTSQTPAIELLTDQLPSLIIHVFQALSRFCSWLGRPELHHHRQWHQLPGGPHIRHYRHLTYPDKAQGNHYCNRDYGPSATNPNCFHYSNWNGSYFYSNPDGVKAEPLEMLASLTIDSLQAPLTTTAELATASILRLAASKGSQDELAVLDLRTAQHNEQV